MAPAGEGGLALAAPAEGGRRRVRLLRVGPALEAMVTASGAAAVGGGRRRARRRRPSGLVSGDGVEWWRRHPLWNKISRAPPRRW